MGRKTGQRQNPRRSLRSWWDPWGDSANERVGRIAPDELERVCEGVLAACPTPARLAELTCELQGQEVKELLRDRAARAREVLAQRWLSGTDRPYAVAGLASALDRLGQAAEAQQVRDAETARREARERATREAREQAKREAKGKAARAAAARAAREEKAKKCCGTESAPAR